MGYVKATSEKFNFVLLEIPTTTLSLCNFIRIED